MSELNYLFNVLEQAVPPGTVITAELLAKLILIALEQKGKEEEELANLMKHPT